MVARLFLARHGNTFRPEDNPVWVGARSDLPLVPKGLAQAQLLGEALQKAKISPTSLIVGPLRRTRQTATIIANALKISPTDICIDARLTEIDYGAWEGKSTAEIIAAGHEDELFAWNKHSVYPVNAGWKPAEAQIIADTHALLEEASEGTSLIVTSNGILRFFARAAVNASAFPDAKVATGHLCVMEREAKGDWHILHWNQPPNQIA